MRCKFRMLEILGIALMSCTPAHAQAFDRGESEESHPSSTTLSNFRANLLPEEQVTQQGSALSSAPNVNRTPLETVCCHTHRRLFIMMSATVYAFGTLDMHQTVKDGGTFQSEEDPLAKPLVGLPHPAYYATGYALLTGVNWVSWKMEHSRRWHRVSWLPQALTASGNFVGYTMSRRW
jgi:hypothetical protein